MPWPLVSDFSRMLQNPQVAFRDPALRACKVEKDNLGQPKARSGNFATVYRGYGEEGREFAIRVFNRKADLRREAYQAKSEYLENAHVTSLVEFQYDEKGIRVPDGKLYPLLIMEWVPGITLFEWTRDRCREGYQEALTIASDVWLRLVQELADNRIVHGDLQHGNVLVSREGHIKLVDYDCMAVPVLLGQKNFEIGMEPYQHPERCGETEMFLGLDNFSAIVIYVALRALAAAPQLWTKYVDKPGYDKLLFRKQDFENAQASPLYQELLQSPDEQVRDLTYYLFQLTGYALRDVPSVEEVILWCHSIQDLLSQHDWDRAIQLVERMGPDEPIPADLQAEVDKAYDRVRLRQALEDAYRAGSEWRLQELYDPDLLDNYPAAEEIVAKAKTAGEVVRLLEQLGTARRFKRWDVYSGIWNQNYELLNKRPSARPSKVEMKRIRAAQTVQRIVADSKADDKTLVAAWRHFKALGGHPLADDLEDQIRQRVGQQQRLARLRGWLDTVSTEPSVGTDSKLVKAWQKAQLDGAPGADAVAERYRRAAHRLECLQQLRQVAGQSVSLENEVKIVKVASDLPESYHENLAKRVAKARRRLKAYKALQEALKAPRSDLAICTAWQRLAEADASGLASAAIRKRAELSMQRAPILEKLKNVPSTPPTEEMDQQLLEIWDESLLNRCYDAGPWRARFEEARARRELLEQLADAIGRADEVTVSRLRADQRLTDFPLSAQLRDALEQMKQQLDRARYQRRQALVDAVTSNGRTAFADLFDRAMVRDICDELSHHRTLISQFTEEEILPLDRCGLAVAENTEPLQRNENGTVRALWKWPHARVTDVCRLVVCRQVPRADQTPPDIECLHDTTLTYGDWTSAGDRCEFAWDAAWDESTVAVWAVLDLGFHVFYSQPLVLGQIPVEAKKRKRGLFR